MRMVTARSPKTAAVLINVDRMPTMVAFSPALPQPAPSEEEAPPSTIWDSRTPNSSPMVTI